MQHSEHDECEQSKLHLVACQHQASVSELRMNLSYRNMIDQLGPHET